MYITIPCETRVEQTEQSVHLKKKKKTEKNREQNEIFFLGVTPGTYCADGDGPRRPFAQQLI